MRRTKINLAIHAEAERLIRDPAMHSKRKKKREDTAIEDILFGRCRATLIRRFPEVSKNVIGEILMDAIHRSYLR